MNLPTLTSEQFNKVTKDAVDAIKNRADFYWVNESAETYQAYIAGIINTLKPLSEENDISSFLFRLIKQERHVKSFPD